MCGVSAYIGNEPGDIEKIKILGIYNTTRGTDSCGIAIDNTVMKGVDNLANFTNFIEAKILRTHKSQKNYTILVHTRNASQKSTKSDAECAHPFEIKSKKGKVLLVGMHNGVITNESDIAKKYGVKEEKVDSKTILSILAKARTDDKMYKVLEDYEGAAVLIWYYPDEPNTLYIWKGGSKPFHTSTTTNDERPLFIYRVKDETGKFTDQFYLSSIRESLLAIGGDTGYAATDVDKEPSIRAVETNCLIKIIPGEKFRVKPINRNQWSYSNETCNITTYPSKTVVTVTTKKVNVQEEKRAKMLKAFENYPFNKITKSPKLDNNGNVMIDNEPFIHSFHDKGNKVYFLRGRYWQNGHMIGGTTLHDYVVKELDIEGYPADHRLCDKDSLDKYYFFQGLLLQGERDACMLKEQLQDNNVWDDIKKRKLKLEKIKGFVWGFCQNIGDTNGSARHSDGHWATGKYYPMFDYDRVYMYETGWFKGAIYQPTSPTDKFKILKSFETKEPVVVEAAKPIVLPINHLSKTKYSAEIAEAASTITEFEEDTLFNHCYDALASLNSTIKQLEEVKDQDRFKPLYKLFVATKNSISAQIRRVEGKKKTEEQEETNELTTEKGPLYS